MTARKQKRAGSIRYCPRVEALQSRLAPAVSFDADTGLVRITGDVGGPRHDIIAALITTSSFIEVTINGKVHSSDPGAPAFDADLDGATADSVRSILLRALDGDDVVTLGDGFTAASGHVTLGGGNGNDLLVGAATDDLLRGGLGDDCLQGGAGNDTLRGRAGNDTLDSASGADTLLGGIGNDQIVGGLGKNLLRGGGGDDTLTGSGGNDLRSGGRRDDRIDGGEGKDHLTEAADASFVLDNTRLIATYQGQIWRVDALNSIETAALTGGDSDDGISAANFTMGPVTLRGGNGNDVLSLSVASEFNDVVSGGEGTDMIFVPGFPDLAVNVRLTVTDSLMTGFGTDRLIGIEEAHLQGGSGDDVFNVAKFTLGPVTLVGFAGNDILIGSRSSDVILGDEGSDTLQGGAGSDTLEGGGGNDMLNAGAGDDSILGMGGNDSLLGAGGNDTLDGGAGTDTVNGGAGTDKCIGESKSLCEL